MDDATVTQNPLMEQDDETVTPNTLFEQDETTHTADGVGGPVDFLRSRKGAHDRRREVVTKKATIDGGFVYEVKKSPSVEGIHGNRFFLDDGANGHLEPGDHIIGKPLTAQQFDHFRDLATVHRWSGGENVVKIIEWIPQDITPTKISNMKKLGGRYVLYRDGRGDNLELVDAESIATQLTQMRRMRSEYVMNGGGKKSRRKSRRRKTSKRRKSTKRKSTKRRKSKTRRRRR